METEEKQANVYQKQIETFTADIHQLEETIEELKQEKNQLFLNKIEGENSNDEERQNLLRQLTQEKVRSIISLFFFSIYSN